MKQLLHDIVGRIRASVQATGEYTNVVVPLIIAFFGATGTQAAPEHCVWPRFDRRLPQSKPVAFQLTARFETARCLTSAEGTIHDSSTMCRRVVAGISVLALLFGFVAAPHTHAHVPGRSAHEGAHSREMPLVHAHMAPHAHPADHDRVAAAADDHGEEEQIRSADGFVFQSVAAIDAPMPALVTVADAEPALTSLRLAVRSMHPGAHGPPFLIGSPLRAPPTVPPVSA